jgi:hypothetical protein
MTVLLALLLPAFLGFSDAEFDALEAHIAALQKERKSLGNFGDNTRREAVDRRIALLQRAHSNAEQIINVRYQLCVSQAVALHAQPVPVTSPPGAPVVPTPCLNVAAGVVSAAVRMEELEERLRTERWTFSDTAERDRLRQEVASIKAALGIE